MVRDRMVHTEEDTLRISIKGTPVDVGMSWEGEGREERTQILCLTILPPMFISDNCHWSEYEWVRMNPP
jgi:hypothetical protein